MIRDNEARDEAFGACATPDYWLPVPMSPALFDVVTDRLGSGALHNVLPVTGFGRVSHSSRWLLNVSEFIHQS